MDCAKKKKFPVIHQKHKTHTLFHNSPAEVERMDCVKKEKSMLISSHTMTLEHNALLHNSPPKVENGLGRELGKPVLIACYKCTNRQTHGTYSQLTF